MKLHLCLCLSVLLLLQCVQLSESFKRFPWKMVSRVESNLVRQRMSFRRRNNSPSNIPLHYKPQSNDNDDREYFTSFNENEERQSRLPRKSSSNKENRPSFFIGKGAWKSLNKALLIGIFIAGIGTGVTLDSAINTNPKDLASRDAIDRNAPNPKLCTTYGSSAMVLDQRVFVTFNPFNVYVTQADTKPGCVLRPANVVPLLQKERQLLTDDDVNACKNGSNTWAFVGDINSEPQLSCVYQSDDAQNEFLSNPKIGLGEDIYEKGSTKPSK